ncbi:MAG: hypothetical protein IPG56_13045 [Caulobacteraceae bacterium]|nr:hypothetical protein [Caulobacteraceae bacterium]
MLKQLQRGLWCRRKRNGGVETRQFGVRAVRLVGHYARPKFDRAVEQAHGARPPAVRASSPEPNTSYSATTKIGLKSRSRLAIGCLKRIVPAA